MDALLATFEEELTVREPVHQAAGFLIHTFQLEIWPSKVFPYVCIGKPFNGNVWHPRATWMGAAYVYDLYPLTYLDMHKRTVCCSPRALTLGDLLFTCTRISKSTRSSLRESRGESRYSAFVDRLPVSQYFRFCLGRLLWTVVWLALSLILQFNSLCFP